MESSQHIAFAQGDVNQLPTAYVSWVHGDEAWQATVLEFATALRVVGGVDADLDLWHLADRDDWATWGPTSIRDSDVVLVAVSAPYKRAWEGAGPSDTNAGTMCEAATLKTLCGNDPNELGRHAKIVVLPGALADDIPADLRAAVDRFELTAFDQKGLEPLLRSIYGKPRHLRPSLAPLPSLPPRFIADVMPHRRDAVAASEAGDESPSTMETYEALAARLTRLNKGQPSLRTERDDDWASRPSDGWLERVHGILQDTLNALERVVSPGTARQRMIGDYLHAQLCVSAGAHEAAAQSLAAICDRLSESDASAGGLTLESSLRKLATIETAINEGLRDGRYRASPGPRHAKPPVEAVLEPEHRKRIRQFYEVARCAVKEPDPTGSVRVIRDALLHGHAPAEAHGARLYERYTERQRIATAARLYDRQRSATVRLSLRNPTEDGTSDPTADGLETAGAEWLADSDLHFKDGALAAVVMSAVAEANLLINLVEHRRSVPVGEILHRSRGDIERDGEDLRRSIVLSTWALTIGESMPWVFSADEQERRAVQADPELAGRSLEPPAPMWLARQVMLLSLYRRAQAFRRLGEHENAYNDLRMAQGVARRTRAALTDDASRTAWLDALDALASFGIGELYRADHDYMQALVHLCRSHDSIVALRGATGAGITTELGRLEAQLSIRKGQAFFEIGALKRSLRWYLTAWRSLVDAQSPDTSHTPDQTCLKSVEGHLDRAKHDEDLDKFAIQDLLAPAVEQMCEHPIEPRYHALAAEILIRISGVLIVLRLPDDDPGAHGDNDSSALRCMKRAAELDDRNLLVQTGLLRYELRRPGSIADSPPRRAIECWSSGASDVEQLIRAGEHLTLERLHATEQLPDTAKGEGEVAIARALVGHFMTHTDSIHLRGAILHHYLMRPRTEHREVWWSPSHPSGSERALPRVVGRDEPYLEFLCLRRFGSFTPFMPRPAAVSAVGGGYLARICRPRGGVEDVPQMYNILVDPGQGTINNLYGAGLSIADIDTVIATHDHPDALSALDSILSLRRERRTAQAHVEAEPVFDRDGTGRLLILGNTSVVNRYSFLNGDGMHLVHHVADAEMLSGGLIPRDVRITALPTQHVDLGGHDAVAFVLSLAPETADDTAGAPLTITFMTDTAIAGLHVGQLHDTPVSPSWRVALQSDIVVTHVSDIPSSELREMAAFPRDDIGEIGEFVTSVSRLAEQRKDDASQLMHALSLSAASSQGAPWPMSLMRSTAHGEHLYLRGLLEVCEHMRAATPSTDAARVLVVGDLREGLGSFRTTIAREINMGMFGDASSSPIALTGDIGLRIRLARPKAGAIDRCTVLCSTCSYDNDRLDLERFHPPREVSEVCIKGDHEAIYWNCTVHDPTTRARPVFVEQMGGYNPFAPGGRYHG